MTIICSIILFITWSFSFLNAIHISKVRGHYINHKMQYSTARTTVTETCPGFISGEAESHLKCAKKILPLHGRTDKRGGRKRKREKHLIIENRGKAPMVSAFMPPLTVFSSGAETDYFKFQGGHMPPCFESAGAHTPLTI